MLYELARANENLENSNDEVDRRKEELKQCPAYVLLSAAEEEAQKTKSNIQELRSEVNALTLEAYEKTGEKKPAPGVGIKVGKKLVYREIDAFDYCQESLPAALKLDTGKFEKYAKAVYEVQPLDFVTIEEVPQATIAKDLSEYLD